MKVNLLALFGAIIFFSRGIIAPMSFKHTYCCMRCGIDHVMCRFPRPGPGPLCRDFIRSGLTHAEKMLILEVHNELRHHVASGKLKKFPAKGANVRELEWDDELELFAKRLADQCFPGPRKVCTDSIRFQVGQNYIVGMSSDKNSLPTIEEHVRNWYRTYKECSPNPKNICMPFWDSYDYTQLVWANTYKIGCSYSEFEGSTMMEREKMAKNILICNYAPRGNVQGEMIYQIGEPCSACSNGTKCSDKYSALCVGNAVRIYQKRKCLFTISIFLVLYILKNFI